MNYSIMPYHFKSKLVLVGNTENSKSIYILISFTIMLSLSTYKNQIR